MGIWHTGRLRLGGEEMKEVACGHLGSSGTSSSPFRFLPPTLHLLVLAPVGAGTCWCEKVLKVYTCVLSVLCAPADCGLRHQNQQTVIPRSSSMVPGSSPSRCPGAQ